MWIGGGCGGVRGGQARKGGAYGEGEAVGRVGEEGGEGVAR